MSNNYLCLDLGSTKVRAAVSTGNNLIHIPILNDLENFTKSNNRDDNGYSNISKIHFNQETKESSLGLTVKNMPIFTVGGKDYSYSHLIYFFRQIREKIQKLLNYKIEGIIISTPVGLYQNKHDLLREAARIAGFKSVRLLDKASSIALSYYSGRRLEKIAVITLGGQNFNVALFELGDGYIEKLSSTNLKIGGSDFDYIIANWLENHFGKSNGFKSSIDKSSKERIKSAAENAKINLSSASSANISLPYLSLSNATFINLDTTLSKSQFESMIENLLSIMENSINTLIYNYSLSPDEINRVILTGSSSRIPAFQRMVSNIFEKTPINIQTEDDAVLKGLNIEANILKGKEKNALMLDATHHSIGVEREDGSMETIIKKDTLIPVKSSKVFTTAFDNQKTVTIHLIQGESKRAEENLTLDKVQLSGIKPNRKGLAQIKITLDIDAEGTINTYIKYLGNVNTKNDELPALNK